MATDDEHLERPLNGLMDYKTAFYSACGLIVILGGGAWGIWNTNAQGDIDDLKRVNQLQWERLSASHDAILLLRTAVEQSQKILDDQETRIRALERRSDRR